MKLVAAVDLGSNSFRLLIGRVVDSALGHQIYPLDNLKEVVRLAAGLTSDKRLDSASQTRALAALQRFGERLRSFSPDRVRAVATNTLRVAKNGKEFLATAEAALGFPIEIIAGREEARLIYTGVAHSMACDGQRRLVVDIGGGSTEFIIGTDYEPSVMESIYIGCVRFSKEFFPDGEVSRSGMKAGMLAARKEIEVIRKAYLESGWDQAIGSSGTARAINEVLALNGFTDQGITVTGLEKLRASLIRAGRTENSGLQGLRQDRVPVFAGGVAIMSAIFEELEIARMDYGEGALRLGVLYDLVGRVQHSDMRRVSVEQMMRRYSVDAAQARRIGELAVRLWKLINIGSAEEQEELEQRLMFASCLHEIGHSISHNSFHKHSSYILAHADLPGFSRREQQAIAAFALGQQGKLAKVQGMIFSKAEWAALMCFRIACLFYRRRTSLVLPQIAFSPSGSVYRLGISGEWLAEHPLTEFSLQQESAEWAKQGIDLQLQAVSADAARLHQSTAGA